MTRNKLAIFDRTLFEPLFQNSVGLEEALEHLFNDFLPAANSVSYPPYNIRKEDERTKVIEMALAGYGQDDLEITVDGNILCVCGDKTADVDDTSVNYVYRGVAARKFERKFVLAEGAEIVDAAMKDGMLFITVQVKEPEVEEPKRITINGGE